MKQPTFLSNNLDFPSPPARIPESGVPWPTKIHNWTPNSQKTWTLRPDFEKKKTGIFVEFFVGSKTVRAVDLFKKRCSDDCNWGDKDFFCVGLGEMTLYGDERHGGTNSLNKNAFLVFWFQPI